MSPANSKKYMNGYMYWKGWFMKSKKHKAENASRKRAARKKKPWKWMEVDHIDSNPMNNSPSNLKVTSRRKNRIKWAFKAIKSRKSRKSRWGKY